MSREALIIISRIIVVSIFIFVLIAAVLGSFIYTLIVAATGMFIWLIYLVSADLGKSDGSATPVSINIGRVLAGLGLILAVSSFLTYGFEQTIWGGFNFRLEGAAISILILFLTMLPLIILTLTRSSSPPHVPGEALTTPSDHKAGTQMQDVPGANPPAYPPGYYPYDPEMMEEEDWDEDDEDEEEDDEDEDEYEEYEDEDEEEDDDEE